MNHAIAACILAFLVGSCCVSMSVKFYRSVAKTEDAWHGKAMSLELDGIIRDHFMFSFLLFLLAIGFYGFSIYTIIVTVFGSAI